MQRADNLNPYESPQSTEALVVPKSSNLRLIALALISTQAVLIFMFWPWSWIGPAEWITNVHYARERGWLSVGLFGLLVLPPLSVAAASVALMMKQQGMIKMLLIICGGLQLLYVFVWLALTAT